MKRREFLHSNGNRPESPSFYFIPGAASER